MKKLKLDAEEVAVESFPTAEAAGEPRGTVQAAAGCTYAVSCPCPSALYHCGDMYQTSYSCQYSRMDPCPTSYYEC